MKVLLVLPQHPDAHSVTLIGESVEQALRSLGHQVVVDDSTVSLLRKASTRLFSRSKTTASNTRLRKLVDEYEPHLFLTLYGFNLDKDTLEYIQSKNVVTACWWLNDPVDFKETIERASAYNYWFSNSQTCARYLKNKKQIQAYFLPPAVNDHYFFAPTKSPSRKANKHDSCDVAVLGDCSAEQAKLLLPLHQAGLNMSLYGDQKNIDQSSPLHANVVRGKKTLDNKISFIRSSKLVINFREWGQQFNHGVSADLFDVAACGVAQVTDQMVELPLLYKTKEDVLVYDSSVSLLNLVGEHIKKPKALDELASSAHRKTLSSHSYKVRVQELLTHIFG